MEHSQNRPTYYCILRFAEVKESQITPRNDHMERRKAKCKNNPDIDPSRTHLNYHLVNPKGDYIDIIKKRVEEEKKIRKAERSEITGTDKKKRRRRRVIVKKTGYEMLDLLVDASPGFFTGRTDEEIREYFEYANEFIFREVGKENIISAVVHMDEKTPHESIEVVPLHKRSTTLSAGAMTRQLGGKIALRERFFVHMFRKYHEFSFAIPSWITNIRHLHSNIYKNKANLLNDCKRVSALAIKACEAYETEFLIDPSLEKTRQYLTGLGDHAHELPWVNHRVRENDEACRRIVLYLKAREKMLQLREEQGLIILPTIEELKEKLDELVSENRRYRVICRSISMMPDELKEIFVMEILAKINLTLRKWTPEKCHDICRNFRTFHEYEPLEVIMPKTRPDTSEYILIDHTDKEMLRWFKAKEDDPDADIPVPRARYLIYDSNSDGPVKNTVCDPSENIGGLFRCRYEPMPHYAMECRRRAHPENGYVELKQRTTDGRRRPPLYIRGDRNGKYRR